MSPVFPFPPCSLFLSPDRLTFCRLAVRVLSLPGIGRHRSAFLQKRFFQSSLAFFCPTVLADSAFSRFWRPLCRNFPVILADFSSPFFGSYCFVEGVYCPASRLFWERERNLLFCRPLAVLGPLPQRRESMISLCKSGFRYMSGR